MKTFNPATEELIKEYTPLSDIEVEQKIATAQAAFLSWRQTSFAERKNLLLKVAKYLEEHKEKLAETITAEMGKPITASIAEVEKCASVCTYYAENAEKFLAPDHIATSAKKSYVLFQPLGIIFAVMPWNFPLWQVFRFAAPALMAGNVGLLKHATNVSGCSVVIEEIFTKAGYPEGAFQSLLIPASAAEKVIRDPRIKAVTLTGSEKAGSAVAATSGEMIKKTVLELGGSDPFIVLDDADVEKAAATAVSARLVAAGQSCIAAKRFIVHEKIYDEFIKLFKEKMEAVVVGDPTDPKTAVGPLSSESIRTTLDDQVQKSVAKGAMVVTGGQKLDRAGYFYAPTILSNVTKGMPVYDEETFGLVAAVIKCESAEDALRIANDTLFGLGGSVWTKNEKTAELFINGIESGCVFVNSMVKSDPRVPFGGTKASGYGRELSSYGIREFVNIKTVWVE